MSSEVKLPSINNGGKFKQSDHIVGNAQEMRSDQSGSSVHGDIHKTPYKLPTDDEVFYYRDKEKNINNEQKKNAKNHKIWDKKTASTKDPLKNFKNFGHPVPKKLDHGEGSKKSIGDKADSTLITEAFNIVMDRKKQRDNMKHYSRNKETMTEVVSQKKEIFLVTMTTKIIKEETEKLQRLIENKKQALHQ
jgi:hypothetical protein